MKKEHAEHNKRLCEHLLKEGTFNDWVITTAFYSSIHFIDFKLFPLEYSDGNEYETIDDLNFKVKERSKHILRAKIVEQYLPSQMANYKFLKDACWTARYNNYKVSKGKASICKQRLEAIEKECTK